MEQRQQVAVGNQSQSSNIRTPPILNLPNQHEQPPNSYQQLIPVHSSSSSSTTSSSITTAPSPTNTMSPSGSTSTKLTSLTNLNVGQKQQDNNDQNDQKITFHLKTSIFTRRVTINSDKMALGLIKQLAIAFLNEIYFDKSYPPDTYIGDYIKKNFNGTENLNALYEKLVLRKYIPEQDTFAPFNSVSDINQGAYICIEISERQTLPASLSPLVSSAYSSTTGPGGTSNFPSSPSSLSQPTVRISHDLHIQTYLKPTYCSSCSNLIKGFRKQGFQCNYCKRNFCTKCKEKAEATSEACLAMNSSPNTSSASSTTASNQTTPQTPTIVNHVIELFSNDNQTSSNNSDRSEPSNNANMSKRKSASNLLHFNIANPFKSHHHHNNHQSGQTNDKSTSKSMRGSAGALDPVLQQLSRQMRSQAESKAQNISKYGQQSLEKPFVEQTKKSPESPSNMLLSVQAAQLSSSHQNLFTTSDREIVDENVSGCSSAHQSPIKGNVQQLSNSARTSARDILHATSPTRRDQVSYHSFVSFTHELSQTVADLNCGVCNKSLRSKPNPVVCKTCKLQVHDHCQDLALDDCLTRITESSRAAAIRDESQDSCERTGLKNTNSNVSRDNIRLHRLATSVRHKKKPDSTITIIEGWLQHKTSSDRQTRKHFWRLDQTDITLWENDTSNRYFKAIALNQITRVLSSSSLPKIMKEDVALSSQLHDKQHQQPKSVNTSPTKNPELRAQMNAMFAFEVDTESLYLVQANDETEAYRWKITLKQLTSKCETVPTTAKIQGNEEEKGVESKVVADTTQKETNLKENQCERENEQNIIPAVLKQPQVVEKARHHHHHYHAPSSFRGQHKTYTDPNHSRLYNRPRIVIQLDPMSVPDHWIIGKYLIERDRNKKTGYEELGSGQFGKVYAAITEIKAEDTSKGLWSGIPVAIKEISKARFDLRQQEKLKNEATILSRLDHPGVIILERVHDLQDKLYIVMEQLEDDMLEMIVSTEEKRLNERVTKFLTYQILEALKYLHSQNIAHCDLKPENVLLVERRSQFPQIKLCDFGFAKIIEDNSFRSSLVGTPAYLAPEVVKGERYNRSVDLWSVGVIVYVSLSGEFPFNEGENIHDQISRANFMYPDQPWASVSEQAKNFINSLLRVNSDKRLSANRAQMDDWIQDFQLWCDLCDLELRIGRRWVTDDADYERWLRYAKLNNKKVPRSAILLHQQLQGD